MELFAITSYFNPSNYSSRLKNYRIFRNKITVPLIAIEVSFNGDFQLNPHDADVVIQIKDSSILWQKERLLNIALDYVPNSAKNIAWLDCDIIFENENWPLITNEALETNVIVQLFDKLYDLPKGEIAKDPQLQPSGRSIVALQAHVNLNALFIPQTSGEFRTGACGLAWAARRELIQHHRFYDTMIAGSGDRALAAAAIGRFEEVIVTTRMNTARRKHYLMWANNFHAAVNQKISYIPGNLLHLWHGNLANRKYKERHLEFAKFNFDPSKDLCITESGCYALKAPGGNDLHEYLKEYFNNRKEDE